MGNDNHALVFLPRKFCKNLHDGVLRMLVKVPGGFIRDEYIGVVGYGSRYAYALLFAARQL
jgi:hypothetical protein